MNDEQLKQEALRLRKLAYYASSASKYHVFAKQADDVDAKIRVNYPSWNSMNVFAGGVPDDTDR